MALVEVGEVMFGDQINLIQWFQQKGLISQTRQCHRCPPGTMMVLTRKSDVVDGFKWRCPTCRTFASVRGGSVNGQESFFHKSKVSLKIWLMMIWFWSIDFPVTKAATQAKIAQSSAIAFYQWLRDVCSWKLLQSQIVLGGPNKVVHIDESLFRHQPKVNNMFLNCCMEINISFNYKNPLKNGRGRQAPVDAWVFGMVDTSQAPSIGYMELVPNRTAATLLPIIQQHVVAGTDIYSDQWRAYSQVCH